MKYSKDYISQDNKSWNEFLYAEQHDEYNWATSDYPPKSHTTIRIPAGSFSKSPHTEQQVENNKMNCRVKRVTK